MIAPSKKIFNTLVLSRLGDPTVLRRHPSSVGGYLPLEARIFVT
jgi:hypothetical protein